MIPHTCDPDPDPRGGIVTYTRVLRILIEDLKDGGSWQPVLGEIITAATDPAADDDLAPIEWATFEEIDAVHRSGCCVKCTAALIGTIAGIAAAAMHAHNPDILMAYELELAAIAAGE